MELIKQRIADLLKGAIKEAQGKGILPSFALPEVVIEYPPNPQYGDYASSFPLKLARATRLNPLAIAYSLLPLIPSTPEIEKIEIAPPGFINFTLSGKWLAQQVDRILEVGEAFGDLNIGKGKRVQIEFVSVNPTGPLHIGHGRGAVLGSTLARVLSSAGYKVEREYYINDAGSQMDAFNRSLYARYLQVLGKEAEVPADGYHGAYLLDLAREIKEKYDLEKEEDVLRRIGKIGMERVLEWIREDLNLLRVEFDNWFSEKSLIENGQLEKVIKLLRDKGYIEEREGALWFVSTALGESKDNVLIRSTGVPTYFATDIAYHYNKFYERGYDLVINIWGADHWGHLSRMKAAITALGIDPERLKIIISQMVSLKKGEEAVKVSKRSGEILTLRELIEEVGVDACRFFFLSRSPDSQMDFDIELAKKQSPDNPVYYIQYAYARICSILRKARERGYEVDRGDVSLLTADEELSLIRKMILLPEVIESVALNLEPHHLAYYALDLATQFHNFYERCRVLSADRELSSARLKLVRGAQVVLSKTLYLMGMSAPEVM